MADELKKEIDELPEGKYGVRHISHCAAAWPIVEKSQLLARIKQLNAAQENLAPQQRVAYTDETIKFVGPFLHLHLGNPRTGGKI